VSPDFSRRFGLRQRGGLPRQPGFQDPRIDPDFPTGLLFLRQARTVRATSARRPTVDRSKCPGRRPERRRPGRRSQTPCRSRDESCTDNWFGRPRRRPVSPRARDPDIGERTTHRSQQEGPEPSGVSGSVHVSKAVAREDASKKFLREFAREVFAVFPRATQKPKHRGPVRFRTIPTTPSALRAVNRPRCGQHTRPPGGDKHALVRRRLPGTRGSPAGVRTRGGRWTHGCSWRRPWSEIRGPARRASARARSASRHAVAASRTSAELAAPTIALRSRIACTARAYRAFA
jgi:hypothetical protein